MPKHLSYTTKLLTFCFTCYFLLSIGTTATAKEIRNWYTPIAGPADQQVSAVISNLAHPFLSKGDKKLLDFLTVELRDASGYLVGQLGKPTVLEQSDHYEVLYRLNDPMGSHWSIFFDKQNFALTTPQANVPFLQGLQNGSPLSPLQYRKAWGIARSGVNGVRFGTLVDGLPVGVTLSLQASGLVSDPRHFYGTFLGPPELLQARTISLLFKDGNGHLLKMLSGGRLLSGASKGLVRICWEDHYEGCRVIDLEVSSAGYEQDQPPFKLDKREDSWTIDLGAKRQWAGSVHSPLDPALVVGFLIHEIPLNPQIMLQGDQTRVQFSSSYGLPIGECRTSDVTEYEVFENSEQVKSVLSQCSLFMLDETVQRRQEVFFREHFNEAGLLLEASLE